MRTSTVSHPGYDWLEDSLRTCRVLNGDGTFRDPLVEAGFCVHPGKGMGVAAADSELTGKMDLMVTNDKVITTWPGTG